MEDAPFPLRPRLKDLSPHGEEALEWLGLWVYKCSLHFYFLTPAFLAFSRRDGNLGVCWYMAKVTCMAHI